MSAVLAAGCATGLTVVAAPSAPLSSAWGIAVYPVTFRFQVPQYESFARGRVIADILSDQTNCLVYGPGEFRVFDSDGDDPRQGTNLGAVIRYSPGHMPAGLYALRTTVDRLVEGGTATTVVEGPSQASQVAARGGISEQVSVRVELISVSRAQVVAELEGKATVDLLDVEMETDPFPNVTRLTRQLVASLIKTAGLAPNRTLRPTGLTTVPALGPALAFAQPGQESFLAETANLDPIDREARVIALVHRFDPAAPRARQRIHESSASGLIVTAVSGDGVRAGLQPGDLIVSAGGVPVLGMYVLNRCLAEGPCPLRVMRGSAEVAVTWQSASDGSPAG